MGKRMKKTLSLLLALIMVLGMVQLDAFAAQAEHVHNDGGWTCVQAEDTRALTCAHAHDGSCGYAEGAEEVPCDCGAEADEEGNLVHAENCAHVPAEAGTPCTHEHTEECYTVTPGAWTCTAPEPKKPDYATMDDLNAAFEAVGETDDVDSSIAAVDEYLAVFDRLSPEDQAANQEGYQAALAYRQTLEDSKEGNPNPDIDVLDLRTGHYLQVTVQKVYKTAAGTYKEYQGSTTAYIYCTDGTTHSGFNHGINVSDNFSPEKLGWSADGWLGWAKGNYWPGSYTAKWYSWQTVTTTINASVTGSEPYKASQYIYLVYQEPTPEYTYTLNYNANGGSGAPAQQTATSTAASYNFTVASGKPTRTDYTFKGWSTNANATSPSYYGGSTINVTGTTTLYAVWEKNAQNVTLTYDANGGNNAPAATTQAKGSEFTVKDKGTMTRDGYTFQGWSTDPNATVANWMPGDTLTLDNNLTLYAVWKQTDPASIKPNETFKLEKTVEGLNAGELENITISYTTVCANTTSGTLTASGTLTFSDATVDEDASTITWNVPYFYGYKLDSGINATNVVTITETADVNGYEYAASSSSGAVDTNTDGTITIRIGSAVSSATRKFTNTYTPTTPTTANYTVYWYDTEGNQIKDPETRTGTVGETVSVTNSDKTVTGYIFDADNANNKTEATLASGGTVLKLYFKQEGTTTPETKVLNIKKVFTGIEAKDIPANFALSYSVDGSDAVTLNGTGASKSADGLTWTWQVQIPKAAETVAITESGADVPGKDLTVTAIKSTSVGYTVTVNGTVVQFPAGSAGSGTGSSTNTGSGGYDVTDSASSSASTSDGNYVSDSASSSASGILLPAAGVTITNSYTDKTNPDPDDPKPEMVGNGWSLDIVKEISNYRNTGTPVTVEDLPAGFAIDVTVSYFNGTKRVEETKTLTVGDDCRVSGPFADDNNLSQLVWNNVFTNLPEWRFDLSGNNKTKEDFADYNTIITIQEKNYSIDGYTCTVSALSAEGTLTGSTLTIVYGVEQSGSNRLTQLKFGLRNRYQQTGGGTGPVDPNPVDDGKGVTIEKTRAAINGDASLTEAKAGDTITWNIVVKNNSNVEKTVNLTEQLPNATLSENQVTLAAGASKTVTATYTVTGNETLENGKLVNTVTGTTGDTGDNEDPVAKDDGTKIKVTVTVKFVDENGNVVDTKEVEVEKGKSYDVTDETKDIPAGYEPNGNPTGDPVTGTADKDKTITVPVKKTTTPENPDPVNPDPVIPGPVDPNPVDPDPVIGSYTLTIYYVDENGNTVAATYTVRLPEGAAYSVNSPAVEGYTPDQAVVSGVMRFGGVTVTVVYTADEADIEDDNPPLADLPDFGDDTPDADLPRENEETPDGEEEITDEDVPLSDVPRTGDHTNRFLVMAAVSGLCLLTLLSGRRKEDEA